MNIIKVDNKIPLVDGKAIEASGGGAPVINPLSVTENGTYNAPSGVDGYAPVTVNVPQGITPTGNINITDTTETDVTNYATAQVVDADLIASNIKKDVNILGIIGTFEGGGGGSLPSSISKIDGGSFTFATSTKITEHISHNLGVVPRAVVIWTEEPDMGQYCYGGMLIRYESTGATGWRLVLYRSGSNMGASSGAVSDFTAYMDSDFFSLNHNSYSYQAGKTYKWLAWA